MSVASALRLVQAHECPPQRWRNGGGLTRELLAWPDSKHWRLRISMADIELDGAFSAFPGTVRTLAILDGAGIRLALPGAPVFVYHDGPCVTFDGTPAPYCTLLNGSVRDLNLMARQGQPGMLPVLPSQPCWTPPALAQAGLFTRVAGRWISDAQVLHLPAHTLLWQAHPQSAHWCFQPDTPTSAHNTVGWWLYYLENEVSA